MLQELVIVENNKERKEKNHQIKMKTLKMKSKIFIIKNQVLMINLGNLINMVTAISQLLKEKVMVK